MDYDSIFSAYYRQYRGAVTVPDSSDREYALGLELANEALTRWANYDNTFWQVLYTTPQDEGDVSTILASIGQYEVPDNFKAPGGDIKILDSNGNLVCTYQLLSPEQPQFRGERSQYAFFTGNPNDGYQLNINPVPDSAVNGMDIKYVYYKTPTLYTTGSSISEIPNPYFIVHRMLANRFRASRNPYYSDALRDAEDALRIMKMENDSGSWANPVKVVDNSGSVWGD